MPTDNMPIETATSTTSTSTKTATSAKTATSTTVDPKIQKVLDDLQNPILFDGEDTLFKTELSKATVYAEIGMGQSTVFADRQEHLEQVIAVDTSPEWTRIVQYLTSPKTIVAHVDLGSVGNWGRPISYEKRDNIRSYSTAVFRGAKEPDLVLIDGRFRVFCFLTVYLLSKPGTRIIFDDYLPRKHYHVIEELVQPVAHNKRQVVFQRESGLNENETRRREFLRLIDKFEYVMD
jgi:hypothetical protein